MAANDQNDPVSGLDSGGNYPLKVISSSNPLGDLNGYISVTASGQLQPNYAHAQFPSGETQTLRVCVVDGSTSNPNPSPYRNGSMIITVNLSFAHRVQQTNL